MCAFKILEASNEPHAWNDALKQFPNAGIGHLYEWGETIKAAYGMDSVYLAAKDGSRVQGLLPLVFVQSRLLPGALVSMPYLNDGGILANDRQVEIALWAHAQALMRKNRMEYLELRHTKDMALGVNPRLDKIAMILDLAAGRDHVWMKKIHSNVRNKIRKSQKMGVEVREGTEWLEAFYRMHLIRMQELGSPPHSLDFFAQVAERLKDRMRIYVALRKGEIIGGKIVCIFNDTLYFLWVSSPDRYLKYAAVTLMDWQAIHDAINHGVRKCDFGRSTVGSSHFDFKAKWGAIPSQLYWHTYSPHANNYMAGSVQSKKYQLFSRIWRRLPLPLVRWIGPKLRAGLPQ